MLAEFDGLYSQPQPIRDHPSLAPDYLVGSTGSTATSLSGTLDPSKGRYFIDEYGRRVLLHGTNVSGNAKIPKNGETHLDLGGAFPFPSFKLSSYAS